MFKKKVAILYVFVSIVASSLLTYFLCAFTPHKNTDMFAEDSDNSTESTSYAGCNYKFVRMKNYKFISPLISTESMCESPKYSKLKDQISNYLESQKQTGQLTYASVYVENLEYGEWFAINPEQGYHPGSLCKVPVMLTYLRMADSNPKLMDWAVNYSKDPMRYPPINYNADTISLGHTYTLKQQV